MSDIALAATISGWKAHYTIDGRKTLCGQVVSNGTDSRDMCKRCTNAWAKRELANARNEYYAKAAETRDGVMSQAEPVWVVVNATAADGSRFTYAHIPNGDAKRVALFMAEAKAAGFKDVTTLSAQEDAERKAEDAELDAAWADVDAGDRFDADTDRLNDANPQWFGVDPLPELVQPSESPEDAPVGLESTDDLNGPQTAARSVSREESYGTIWVCECCYLTNANGECCNNDDHGGDGCVPLSSIDDGFRVAAGIAADDHATDCLDYILHELREQFPELDWPEVPGDHECECATNTYSYWLCDGCDSRLHGARHGMTLFGPARGSDQ